MARGRTALYREQGGFDVIRGGRAAGRNVRDICGDLEEYVNKPNGGEIVAGRWGNMFPNTEEGRREAIKHEYLAERFPGLQYGTPEARDFLKQPDANMFIQHRMATAFGGRTHIPDAVKQYAARLGKAGLDYRAIRIARTETVAMVADEQLAIAENSDICTGEMDFVMERGRDAWPCNCEKYASKSPWKVDDPERPEIPVHPNCMCEWRLRLKTDAEILASLREEMKEDLKTFEGTDEQREMLDMIDRWVCPRCGYVEEEGFENSKYRNGKKCPVCGHEMREGDGGDDRQQKKLIDDGYIISSNQNIHISLTDNDIMEIEQNARPIKGEAWGSAIRGNEKAEGFAYVNSSVYRPLNYAADGLHENYQSNISRERLEIAIGQRIHAQEQIKSVIASREEMPYFLRGEELSREAFDKMIADNERDLTGSTSLTASERHNNDWIREMLDDDENYVTVRFHFFRDDTLEYTVGLVSQNDLDNLNKDITHPDEVAIGATKFIIDKVQEGKFDNFTIYDIWGKVKR